MNKLVEIFGLYYNIIRYLGPPKNKDFTGQTLAVAPHDYLFLYDILMGSNSDPVLGIYSRTIVLYQVKLKIWK